MLKNWKPFLCPQQLCKNKLANPRVGYLTTETRTIFKIRKISKLQIFIKKQLKFVIIKSWKTMQKKIIVKPSKRF